MKIVLQGECCGMDDELWVYTDHGPVKIGFDSSSGEYAPVYVAVEALRAILDPKP